MLTRRLLLLFFVCFGGLSAQLIKLPEQQAVTEHSNPSPVSLKTNWWQYFAVKAELLEDRISEHEALLNRLLVDVPAEQRPLAEARAGRILVNLRALPGAKGQQSDESFVSPAMQTSYTITEILRLVEELEQVRDIRTNEEAVVLQMQGQIADGGKDLDTKMAQYLQIGEDSVEKLLLGLDIIGQRAALAVVEEKLRVQQSRFDRTSTRFDHLEKALEVASNSLVIGDETPSLISSRIERSELLFQDAQRRRLQAEGDAVSALSDTPLAQATALRLQQRALRLAVEESDAQMALIRDRVHRQVLLHMGNDELEQVSTSAWKDEIANSLKKAAEWQTLSKGELGRAGDALSAVTDDGALKQEMRQRITLANETLLALQRLEVTQKEAELLLDIYDEQQLAQAPGVVRFGSWIWNNFWEVGGTVITWLQQGWFKIGGVPVTAFGVLRAIFIILLFLWGSRLTQRALSQAADQQWGIAKSTFYAVSRLIHYLLLTIGIVVALASVGLDFSNLALVFGALSVGIGFGLQGIVNNFLSGLIILFERPLRVGDYLELETGYRGRVTAINVRSTHLRTNDGIDVVIPNAEIIGGRVVNWTMRDAFRRVHVPFGVAYSSDKELVKKAALEAATRVECTLQGVQKYGEPEVWLTGYGDNALNFELIVWVNARAAKQYQRTMASYYWELHTSLQEYGIEIPFPQRDVWFKTPLPAVSPEKD